MKKDKFRCHPSIVIERLFPFIYLLIFYSIFNIDNIIRIIKDGMTLERVLIRGFILIIFLVILIYNIVIWYSTYIYIENDIIVIRKKAMFYRKNTYAIENISNINLEQNLFERIIGTYKVKIDTDSLSTADTTDIEIVLSKKQAYKFKDKILQIMSVKKHKSKPVKNRYIKYKFKDRLKHCFFKISFIGLTYNLLLIELTKYLALNIDSNQSLIAIFIIDITAWYSIMKYFIGDLFKYHNFTIVRKDDSLYISYGLFKLRKFNIPINRINAINIEQTFISRIFKRYESSIVTIGVGDSQCEGSKILLYTKQDEFFKNMKILIPEMNIKENLNLTRESKRTFIIRFFNVINSMIILNMFTVYSIYTFNMKIDMNMLVKINQIFLVISIVYNFLGYITKGIYTGEHTLAISTGIFIKHISIINYKKIQYTRLTKTPISSLLNLYKGQLSILAGANNNKINTGYYNKSIYNTIKKRTLKDII